MDNRLLLSDVSYTQKVHETKRCSDVVSELTNDYRSNVVSLAETSNTQIGWVASQHALEGLWQSARNASNTVVDFDAKWIDYACQECGYLLHPGCGGTRIRTSRPQAVTSKTVRNTLRRREQRKRKHVARVKQMKAKDNGRGASSKQNTADSRLVLLENAPNVSRLDRNHLVLTCGRCRAKYFLKGPSQAVAPRDMRTSTAARAESAQKVIAAKMKDAVASEATGRLDGNFVSLPPTSNGNKNSSLTASGTRTNAFGALTSPPLTLLEQRQQERFGNRKRRQIKNAAPNCKLLNFLSSLNDP